mgnify:CR=1 FL=1
MKQLPDNFFTDLKNEMPYFKAALDGQAGSGKTYTAARIAGGLHHQIGSQKPVVIFDTETSSKFLQPFFHKKGVEVRVKKSRSLTDLIETMKFCESGGSDVLMIDSITHVWESFLEAYRQKKNRTRLEFQDWMFIKPEWKREFADRLVMGHFHIVFTGRQGYTYEYQVNEETQKRELIKTGTKMKVEGETAYEPDLVIGMELCQELKNGKVSAYRQAFVLKDRSDLIDGKTIKNPTYKDFKPVVDFLLNGSTVGEALHQTSADHGLIVNEEANRDYGRERQKWLERCNSLLDKHAGGQKREDKLRRVDLMEKAFGDTSETAISELSVKRLEDAWITLKQELEPETQRPVESLAVNYEESYDQRQARLFAEEHPEPVTKK